MTEAHDVWVADGATALQALIGKVCPKRPAGDVAALDCPYCIADALYEQHAVVERERDTLRRLAEALAHDSIGGRCALTAEYDETSRSSRCKGNVKALRWESGFIDEVCEPHAVSAEARGAVVVRPRKHDGTER